MSVQSISIPLRRIKINTGKMENVSWLQLLGRRRALKRAIQEVAQSDPNLQAFYAAKGRLNVDGLGTGHYGERGSLDMEKRGVYNFVRVTKINSFVVDGFTFSLRSGQYVKITDPS